MTPADRPFIIVTLPARSANAALEEARAAASSGADLAEVRFDRWPAAEREGFDRLFPAPLPLVATLRSDAEGGEGPSDADSRRRWLALASRWPFALVDRELARDGEPDASGPERGPATIWSAHLPEGADPGRIRAGLDRPRRPGDVAKVVVPAGVAECLTRILPLATAPSSGRRILHTVGPSGPLLRAWAGRLALAGVYARLPDAGGTATVEPSQLPVDRLRPFLEAGPTAPLFAVVGHPVAHSLSPRLHHAWMRAHRSPGLYVALDVPDAEELSVAVARLPDRGFRGLNVTHPLKRAALGAADRTTDAARRCGCANTLTFEDGRVEADNTDLVAMRERLGELLKDGTWDGRELLVVGAGGAARAVLAAASDVSARATILSRSAPGVAELARTFGAVSSAEEEPRPMGLIVHATPFGRREAGPLDVPIEGWLGPVSYVLDYVYRPDDP
ncbi:MAG TPA: type I 3-dehydroquinate dehydratase, partial [Thermoplasmata archaeon]|nr:type I 3-dehydroquinate dehydratase [Thermoplasmata archaeon]